mmetsp:Transcript_50962/g.114601  ORF Transcript_50962/g.114601 Transcript_50962/m.114601 type:complete len:362 (+) Transcript_50962:1013-2098(+)
MLWHRLLDVLHDRLGHLPHHLADLDLWHLYYPLLVDDLRDLDNFLYVLENGLGHLLINVLDLYLWDLLDELPHLDLRNLHNLLLDLHVRHLLEALHKLDLRLVHLLLHLLDLDVGHLPDELSHVNYGNLDELLVPVDRGHLDDALHDLGYGPGHLLLHPLGRGSGHLLDEVHDLHLGHVDGNLLVYYVRHLDDPLLHLVHRQRHLLRRLPVLDLGDLPHHLVDLGLRDLHYLLLHDLQGHLLYPFPYSDLRHLHNLLDLMHYGLLLDDCVVLDDLLGHILVDLMYHGPDNVVDGRLPHEVHGRRAGLGRQHHGGPGPEGLRQVARPLSMALRHRHARHHDRIHGAAARRTPCAPPIDEKTT